MKPPKGWREGCRLDPRYERAQWENGTFERALGLLWLELLNFDHFLEILELFERGTPEREGV